MCLLSAALSSCRQVPVDVAAPRPRATEGIDAARLESGRAIYISAEKCASCHQPKPVCSYSSPRWSEKILPKMAKKAEFNPAEYADVLAYVTSPAAQTPPDEARTEARGLRGLLRR